MANLVSTGFNREYPVPDSGTIIGTPFVVLKDRFGKNLNYYDSIGKTAASEILSIQSANMSLSALEGIKQLIATLANNERSKEEAFFSRYFEQRINWNDYSKEDQNELKNFQTKLISGHLTDADVTRLFNLIEYGSRELSAIADELKKTDVYDRQRYWDRNIVALISKEFRKFLDTQFPDYAAMGGGAVFQEIVDNPNNSQYYVNLLEIIANALQKSFQGAVVDEGVIEYIAQYTLEQGGLLKRLAEVIEGNDSQGSRDRVMQSIMNNELSFAHILQIKPSKRATAKQSAYNALDNMMMGIQGEILAAFGGMSKTDSSGILGGSMVVTTGGTTRRAFTDSAHQYEFDMEFETEIEETELFDSGQISKIIKELDLRAENAKNLGTSFTIHHNVKDYRTAQNYFLKTMGSKESLSKKTQAGSIKSGLQTLKEFGIDDNKLITNVAFLIVNTVEGGLYSGQEGLLDQLSSSIAMAVFGSLFDGMDIVNSLDTFTQTQVNHLHLFYLNQFIVPSSVLLNKLIYSIDNAISQVGRNPESIIHVNINMNKENIDKYYEDNILKQNVSNGDNWNRWNNVADRAQRDSAITIRLKKSIVDILARDITS